MSSQEGLLSIPAPELVQRKIDEINSCLEMSQPGANGMTDDEQAEWLIRSVYGRHNPWKLQEVEALLMKYKASSKIGFYNRVCEKYGEEPRIFSQFEQQERRAAALIREVYMQQNPAKTDEVDRVLNQYAGSKVKLYRRVCEKYGVAPADIAVEAADQPAKPILLMSSTCTTRTPSETDSEAARQALLSSGDDGDMTPDRKGIKQCQECRSAYTDSGPVCPVCRQGCPRGSLRHSLSRAVTGEPRPQEQQNESGTAQPCIPSSSSQSSRDRPLFDAHMFDLLVIGGGPGGVKAALEGAQLGLRVGLIDKKASISGVPTGAHSKCLREAALRGAKSWDEVAGSTGKALKRAVEMTSRQLQAFHVNVLQGTAEVLDQTSLMFTPALTTEKVSKPKNRVLRGWGRDETSSTEPRKLTFTSLVIATGSKSHQRAPVDFSLPGVYDSDSIWGLGRIPKRLVVQGCGIIGLEYAAILKKLGCESCILVSGSGTILPMLDVSLQESCKSTAQAEGLEFIMNSKFEAVEALEGSTQEEPKLRVTLAGGRILECDMILSATGRYGLSAGLGLERLEGEGLKIGRNAFIQVDEWGHTGCGKIYAVGDVAGGNLATIAQSQARRAVIHAFDDPREEAKRCAHAAKPSAVWTIPEIAWAGLNEAECAQQGLAYSSVRVNFSQSLRACVADVEEGFLKLIFESSTGKLLGVHMFGEKSADFINFGAEVLSANQTIFHILRFVFPAVSFHELYSLAATQAKLKIMNANSKSMAAAVTWKQVKRWAEQDAATNSLTVAEALHETFQYLDTDQSGHISVEELKEALEDAGLQISDEVVKNMFEDVTGFEQNSMLDYDTFQCHMSTLEH